MSQLMDASLSISRGVASKVSIKWLGPPALIGLTGQAVGGLYSAQWQPKASGTLAIRFVAGAGVPENPEIHEEQLDQLVSEAIPAELTKLIQSDATSEPTFVMLAGLPVKDAWVAAHVKWYPSRFDKDSEPQHPSPETNQGDILETLRAEEILETLESEHFANATLKRIAESAFQKSTEESIQRIKAAPSDVPTMLGVLEDLVEMSSSDDATQSQNAEALQLVLNELAGKRFHDFESNKRVADLLNSFRKSNGLAFYFNDGTELRRVSLVARPTTRSNLGEFYVATTTSERVRMGHRPWSVFPELTVAVPK